jgi:hypothetical protein
MGQLNVAGIARSAGRVWRLRAATALFAFALAMLASVQVVPGGVRLGAGAVARAQIKVTKARIGCLDIQHAGNLTTLVGRACDGKMTCSYKAPTESAYRRAGVQAATRSFCTQAMEISYRCTGGGSQSVSVPGDAWNHPAAQLVCRAPIVAPKEPKNRALVPILQQMVRR